MVTMNYCRNKILNQLITLSVVIIRMITINFSTGTTKCEVFKQGSGKL